MRSVDEPCRRAALTTFDEIGAGPGARSGYDDDMGHRCHVPKRCLAEALLVFGDRIVYRESRRPT